MKDDLYVKPEYHLWYYHLWKRVRI